MKNLPPHTPFAPPFAPRLAPMLLALFLFQIASQAGLNVVASVPDLGYMATRIGGAHVEVITLATGREDLHAVPVRPSFLPKLNRADLLLSLGLDAEHAWLPAMAREARNPDILPGRKGWVEAYDGIEVLEKPELLDRSQGEQHPLGNPHYNIGPQNGPAMAANIAQAFIARDPDRRDHFEAGLEAYRTELHALQEELKRKGSSLAGVAVVSYHPDMVYLASFYGLRLVGNLEPKPGVQPSAGHLAALAGQASKSDVLLVLHNQAQNPKLPRRFARTIGARSVEIANMVGAKDGVDTWEDLQRHNLDALLQALAGESP